MYNYCDALFSEIPKREQIEYGSTVFIKTTDNQFYPVYFMGLNKHDWLRHRKFPNNNIEHSPENVIERINMLDIVSILQPTETYLHLSSDSELLKDKFIEKFNCSVLDRIDMISFLEYKPLIGCDSKLKLITSTIRKLEKELIGSVIVGDTGWEMTKSSLDWLNKASDNLESGDKSALNKALSKIKNFFK